MGYTFDAIVDIPAMSEFRLFVGFIEFEFDNLAPEIVCHFNFSVIVELKYPPVYLFGNRTCNGIGVGVGVGVCVDILFPTCIKM